MPMWLSSSVMMMFSMSFMERCSQKVSYSRRFSSSTVSFCMSHCGAARGVGTQGPQGGTPRGAAPTLGLGTVGPGVAAPLHHAEVWLLAPH